MTDRKNFEISQEDFDNLLEQINSARRTSGMYLSGGTPMGNPQETANTGWKVLGDKYGFQHMTVRPISERPLIVSAIPK